MSNYKNVKIPKIINLNLDFNYYKFIFNYYVLCIKKKQQVIRLKYKKKFHLNKDHEFNQNIQFILKLTLMV